MPKVRKTPTAFVRYRMSAEKYRAYHQCSGGGIHIKVVEPDGRANKAGRGNAGGGVGRLVGRSFAIGCAGGHAYIPDSYEPCADVRFGGATW